MMHTSVIICNGNFKLLYTITCYQYSMYTSNYPGNIYLNISKRTNYIYLVCFSSFSFCQATNDLILLLTLNLVIYIPFYIIRRCN